MENTIELEIPLLLPGVESEKDQCLARLEESLQHRKGILRAHLEREKSPVDLCIHYDPNLLTLPDVKRLAQRAGAQIVNRYHHHSIPVEGMDCSDCSLVIEHSVGRMDGVLTVSLNYPAEQMWVEYDTHKISRAAIRQGTRFLLAESAPGTETIVNYCSVCSQVCSCSLAGWAGFSLGFQPH